MLCISFVFHKSLKKAFARVELLLITAGYGFELHEVVYKYNFLHEKSNQQVNRVEK